MALTARTQPALGLAVLCVLTLAGCAGAADPGGATTTTTGTTSGTPKTAASASPTTVSTGPPTAPAMDPSAPAITAPADGATVAGPSVSVAGTGTAVEGTLRWRVLRSGSTDVVTENFTTAGANGVVGPYAFTVTLTPGSYTVEVWEPSMSDGATEDAATTRTTRTFTVT